jgi:ABC-2 type transport system ATP-binding protein
MTGNVIEVAGLVKRYGPRTVVDAVDLTIAHGEVVALLGPNGAGKTTSVEILEGYTTRDAGDVRVLGVDPAAGDRRWRSRIGVVLQSSGGFDELTVREIVHHMASLFPDPADPDETIALVGLTDSADRRRGRLSGGQRRRVDVALGIVGRPALLFLDEPTTGFDPDARRQFWDLIRGLRERGTTMLLTTHYLDEAEALADRICVLVDGRVRAMGTPSELGGRQHATATVSWLEDGERRTAATDEPTQLVCELARRLGGEIPELAVARPSLEDTYLALVHAGGATP